MKKYLLSTLIVLSIIVCVIGIRQATAGPVPVPGDNVSGYAWSGNTGWMQLNNCTDPTNSSTCTGTEYGVKIAADGTMSGYMWSSNLGWISFNAVSMNDDQNSCTPGMKVGGTCVPKVQWQTDGTGILSGYARVCSVFETGCSGVLKKGTNGDDIYRGGWDGFIALSPKAGDPAQGWGVKINLDTTITGHAWGSDVVGWVEMTNAKLVDAGPTISYFDQKNECITPGKSPSFAWESQNAVSCKLTRSGSTANELVTDKSETSRQPNGQMPTKTVTTAGDRYYYQTALGTATTGTTDYTLACSNAANASVQETRPVATCACPAGQVQNSAGVCVATCTLASCNGCPAGQILVGGSCQVPTCAESAIKCPDNYCLLNPNDVRCKIYICNDGEDNDGDGIPDFPNDPGCSSPIDMNEANIKPIYQEI